MLICVCIGVERDELRGINIHLNADGTPRIVERCFLVEEAHAGLRIDHYLKQRIPRLSRTKLQRVIRTQLYQSNGRRMKPHSRVLAGEKYILRREAAPEPPCPRTFDVRFEDASCIVIDKPAGLPMHASAKFYFNTLTRVLLERYPDGNMQICHRLDRETSGLVVVARRRSVASLLKQAFQTKQVTKTYLAIVHGEPSWQQLDIDYPLEPAGTRAPIPIRMVSRPDALPSLTRVYVVERQRGFTLLKCIPVTGRQHQIRAHLALAGYPIVGDKLYAHGDAAFAEYCDKGMTEQLQKRCILPRQALHAASITFPHPETRQPVRVNSPLPQDLQTFLRHRRTMRDESSNISDFAPHPPTAHPP